MFIDLLKQSLHLTDVFIHGVRLILALASLSVVVGDSARRVIGRKLLLHLPEIMLRMLVAIFHLHPVSGQRCSTREHDLALVARLCIGCDIARVFRQSGEPVGRGPGSSASTVASNS